MSIAVWPGGSYSVGFCSEIHLNVRSNAMEIHPTGGVIGTMLGGGAGNQMTKYLWYLHSHRCF